MVRSRCLPLLVLALMLLAGCSLFRSSAKRPPFKKLSPPIAYEIMRDSPEMLVLDLRPPQEYNGETGHIRRALNIPLERLPYRLLEIGAFREETILVYCRADDCGEKGMAILKASGFEDVVLMDGGIDAWIRNGFKTVLPSDAVTRAAQPADGRGPVMPNRPGQKEVAPRQEVPVVPPPSPPPPPPPGPHSPNPLSPVPSLPPSPGERGLEKRALAVLPPLPVRGEGRGRERRAGEVRALAAPRQIG